MSSISVYQRVTDQIVAALEQGVGKWKRPWNFTASDAFSPVNVVSRKPYRGINPLILWGECQAKGYTSGEWGTLRQWSTKGGKVRRGSKATAVVFWKFTQPGKKAEGAEETEIDGRRQLCFVNYYNVFNAAQVDDYQARPDNAAVISEQERIVSAEHFFEQLPSVVQHGGNRACYNLLRDVITMPEFTHFRSAADYYSTLAHEHTHWTGPAHRLDRQMGKRFGDKTYAVEELVAELGAAFIMAELKLASEPREDHAEYIQSWISVMKSDARAIFTAASQAQKAADYLFEKAGRKVVPEEVAA